MKCKQCGNEMKGLEVHDNPKTGYAYNLYSCSCGTICREDVWNNKGKLWILENKEVICE